SPNVTEDSITPLIGQLTVALNNAVNDLTNIPASSSSKKQFDDDTPNLVATSISPILVLCLLGSAASIPTFGALLSGVGVFLNQVLVGLETILAGVLNFVATLLVDVAGLLHSLSFGLVLASL
ncbi:hypothetical protein K435DRAFT_677010, partial [Dendrothele bispora CBS 962.96]